MTSLANKVSIVVLNWNGKDIVGRALESALGQKTEAEVIVIAVDNGSTDGSADYIQKNFPTAELVRNRKNLGFAGGVNSGIRRAIELGSNYVALLNNDAVAEPNWLEHLYKHLESHPKDGIATCKLLDSKGSHLDSTGEGYSIWGLPFPRGRGESDINKYDKDVAVLGASGGASLYRVTMLKQVGLFDEDFFAYYEDIDISLRAQLMGWTVSFVPESKAFHGIGVTAKKISGFATYQTFKNLPWLLWKNIPSRYLILILPRFSLAYSLFFANAIAQGKGWPATKGLLVSALLMPKKLIQRMAIQKKRQSSPSDIWNKLMHSLPPGAKRLQKFLRIR